MKRAYLGGGGGIIFEQKEGSLRLSCFYLQELLPEL